MKVRIKPTEKPDVLEENLETNFEIVGREDDTMIVEAEETDKLERIPGVEKLETEEETIPGLTGSPVDEEAYAKIESREDAVKALLATIMGYDLRILNTGREWDYRQLKKYNPDIKHLKFDEPKDVFDIEKATFDADGLEEIEIELGDEEVNKVYRKMLT